MVDTGEGQEGFSVDTTVTVDGMFQTLFDEVPFVSAQCFGNNSLVWSAFLWTHPYF